MAKPIQAMVKLQCNAGNATPAPPAGPALGQHGINIMEFCKQFNARTQHQAVDAMIALWIARSGCSDRAQGSGPVRGRGGAPDAMHTATRHRYAPCRGGAEVVLWKLTGAGHVWPGGVQDFLPLLRGPGTTVVDANAEMWRCFLRFRAR